MSTTLWSLLAVAIVGGVVVSRWIDVRTRTPAERIELEAIRALWKLAKRAPVRQLLRDPNTGTYLGVDRYRGFVEVIVSEADFTHERTDDIPDAVLTKFGVGGGWRPMPPPIMHRTEAINDDNAQQRTWREAGATLRFNDKTGAMNTSAGELANLYSQLDRALRTQ